MENTALIALSRQAGLRNQMSIIANNLANMNTTSFKRGKALFSEHIEKFRDNQSILPVTNTFVKDVVSVPDFSEGPMKKTGNPLDISIKGDGYFVVGSQDGSAKQFYTRNGSFQLDSQGQLVTLENMPVLSDAGAPIFFAPEDSEITISRDGTISTNNGELGKLRIVEFENQYDLKRVKSGLYETEQPPIESDRKEIIQGMIEGSNVEPVFEMAKMIEVHRAYTAVNKF
ncbi:MAG: flagellar basal-body rod protein FlgF, partial [Rhodospirillales bacterium]|nr:flagellar basal-body rod protein FlgF [Rhodospirillales bacterium]